MENEANEKTEVYNDHSVHHAVNLWPLVIVAAVAAVTILTLVLAPELGKRAEQSIPVGRAYTTVGALLACMPVDNVGNPQVFRVVVRTPDDLFFDVYFRGFHQPLQAGMAIGILKYHECGKVNGQVVQCFDSFKVTHEGLPALDNDGKRVVK